MTDNQEPRTIPSDNIEVIPPTVQTANLIQHALQATRQGTGAASELVKNIAGGALETDLDIHIAMVRHKNLKILMTLREYNSTIQLIQHCQNQRQIDDQLADTTIKHLQQAYEQTLRSSGDFPIGFALLGVICSIATAFFTWQFSTGGKIPDVVKSPNISSQAALTLPLSQCRQGNTSSNQLWYRVLIKQNDEETLNYIKKTYCAYAFVMDVDSSRKVIQVAAFHEQATTQQLAKALENDPKIKNSEVGVPFRTVPKN